ncbi:LysR family transcriptional regulator [Pandoraea sp. ISTKB]|uniref:LysR family transcriptional regulator n=1 Tax=Pandoraea sp. ISTKB TaxID=1586708 RepID=UPI0008469970|nr:LysR family transcriptional regulator [Pandoraea sp. ISTKB]ODP35725.1 LysR family transcriptional regulator [Pandoraea sp. ISTKB]
MDNLGDIRLFVEAAQLGSLSAAGRKLGLSPAAASARLVKLETALRAQLLERSTRNLKLTDEGQLYLAQCQQALQILDDARTAVQLGQGSISGKLRVSATADFGRITLRHWLDEFNERHPQISLSLILCDSLSNLLQDDIDVAIRFGIPVDSGLIAKPLAENRRILCASPAYLKSRGNPRHPSDLRDADCIVMTSTSGVGNQWNFSRGDATYTFVVPTERARITNDGGLAREWAIEGHGLVLKSVWDAADDLRAKRLKIVLPEWRCPDAPVHALFARRQFTSPRVRALLDFLETRFAEIAPHLAPYFR